MQREQHFVLEMFVGRFGTNLHISVLISIPHTHTLLPSQHTQNKRRRDATQSKQCWQQRQKQDMNHIYSTIAQPPQYSKTGTI